MNKAALWPKKMERMHIEFQLFIGKDGNGVGFVQVASLIIVWDDLLVWKFFFCAFQEFGELLALGSIVFGNFQQFNLCGFWNRSRLA